MTDHHDPLDELTSAHLDGHTTPVEAARIAADPELAARVERLASAREALRSTDVPVDPTRRDEVIAAALAAFDEAADDLPVDLAGSTVTDVAPAAGRRRPRRVLELAGIAAAVALLALAVPLLGRLDSGSNDDQASGPDQTSDDLGLRSAGGAQDAAPSTLSAAPGAAPPDLGPFTDLPDLADAVRSQLGAGGTAMESTPAAAIGADAATEPCADGQAAGGPVLYTALAALDGRPVVVVVREDPDGGRTIVVLDRQDCTTVTAGKL